MLDKLEGKKLVRRKRCETDRRQVLCWITPAGEDLLGGLDAEVDRNEMENLRGLTVTQQRQLTGLLDRVRAAHNQNQAEG
jgi:DNA-binding MarR family transcriptional regulator